MALRSITATGVNHLTAVLWVTRGIHNSCTACSALPELVSATFEDDKPQTTSTASRFYPSSPPSIPFTAAALPQLSFDDPQQAYKALSTAQIVRGLAVFKACSVRPLIRNADRLLGATQRVFGQSAVNALVKPTFFGHFCGGESVADSKEVVDFLLRNGVRPILNYAAESDVTPPEASSARPLAPTPTQTQSPVPGSAAAGCEFSAAEAESERSCERNLQVFLRAVRDGATVGPEPITAFKVTAVGPCDLLERLSSVIAVQWGRASGHRRPEALAPDTWRALFPPAEVQQLQNTVERIDRLARSCAEAGVKLLVDAEHTYMQPAIDAIAWQLQLRYNRGGPATVFNTYQCYLKDTHDRVLGDAAAAEQAGAKFGAKLVRGAYMVIERQRAAERGYQCPVQPTMEDTHNNYNRCVSEMMARVAASSAELMVASHNQASVQHAVAAMQRLGLHPRDSAVYFGQLLGMANHLTLTLGANGLKAYKIVPYGPVPETLQYLIRRAQENGDALGGVGKEAAMLRAELWRRAAARLGLNRRALPPQQATAAAL